jgi:hypothetical protein
MQRSVSATAPRSRTAWFLILVKVGGIFEINVGWRYYDGTLGFYSDANRNSDVKPPWGQIISCEFNQAANKKEEVNDYFKFQNELGKRVNFKIKMMNAFLFGVNTFTQNIAALRTGGKDQLLSQYFSLLPKCEGFSHHDPSKHTNHGLPIDDTGEHLSPEELNDLELFIKAAKEAAVDVNSKSDVIAHIGKEKKRKNSGDGEAVVVKKRKHEQMTDDKMSEIKDSHGAENSFITKYLGRADVKFENISLSDKIPLPINEIKVMSLSNTMQNRFDPSLANFTVYPANEKEFDCTNLQNNRYKIIHGVHKFKALQRLDKKGLMETLPDLENRTVTCYIVNVQMTADIVYGNLRGNDLASRYTRKPHIHELIFIYENFKDIHNDKSSKALDLIVRFAKLLLIHPDEITALKKLANWSPDCFQSLVAVLKQFEIYGTVDCKDTLERNIERLKRGEKMKVTKEMFKAIAKCDPEYFKENSPKVLNKELSLKTVIENVNKELKKKKTIKLVSSLTNYQSAEQLEQKFPGKFSDDVIEKYVGAEIGDNGNKKGELLEGYCKSVLEGKELEPVKCEYVEKLLDISTDALEKFDVLVLNLLKFEIGITFDVLDLAVKSSRHTVLLLFGSEKDQFEAMKYISSLPTPAGFILKQVYFEDGKPKVVNDFLLNSVYGILLGTVNIVEPPLKVLNGDLKKNLSDFIRKISPLQARVAFLNEGNLIINCVDKDDGHSEVVYFGSKSSIDRFMKSAEGFGKTTSIPIPIVTSSTPTSTPASSSKTLEPSDSAIDVDIYDFSGEGESSRGDEVNIVTDTECGDSTDESKDDSHDRIESESEGSETEQQQLDNVGDESKNTDEES